MLYTVNVIKYKIKTVTPYYPVLHFKCVFNTLYMFLFYFSGKVYPSAMLARSVNYETKDMLSYVSLIVCNNV